METDENAVETNDSATDTDDVQVDTDAQESDEQVADERTYNASYVKKLREENARRRANYQKDVETAATSAREEFARELGQVLGFLDDDDEDEAVTADRLVAAANAERDAATKRVKRFEVRDAVRSAADTHKGDTALLLPFLRGEGLLDELDPAADDFADTVDAIVEDAIARNPKLKAGSDVSRRSGGDLSGGNNQPKNGPQTVDEIREARRAYRKKNLGLR